MEIEIAEVNKIKIKSIILSTVIILLAFITLYPFVMIVIISFKTPGDFMNNPLGLPEVWTFQNYVTVFVKANIINSMCNSFLVTFLAVFCQIIFGSLAAYALSKMKFKRSKMFSSAFFAPMIFPIQTVIVPLYLIFRKLHLLNSHIGLIIIFAATGLPLVIFIFTGFMKTIPYQISESAFVEGASHLRIYYKLILPLIKPAIATTIVISGLGIWNDFFLPLIMVNGRKLATLPLAVYMFVGQYNILWTSICACIVFFVMPIMLVYLFLQNQIISGIVAGSVKG